MQQDAGARTMSEMEAVLGIPCMRFPLLAVQPWPKLLPSLWRSLKPSVETGEFFQSAQRLQADAYTRMFNYFCIPDLQVGLVQGGRDPGDLGDLVELFQARAALFLLFFSLAAEALEGPVGHSGSASPAPMRPLFPQTHWREEAASWQQNVRGPAGAQITSPSFTSQPEYVALQRWPAFFASYWNCLQAIASSPLYADWQISTRSLAWRLAQELPVTPTLAHQRLTIPGVAGQELDSVNRTIRRVLDNLVAVLLDMAVARIGLEKGSRPAGPPRSIQENKLNPGRVA